MELRCRCHGLSGSCSLKTCWLTLPNFQVIGAYLKKKYENSVHLPTAINVNKLIPMMDRQEISSILSGANAESMSSYSQAKSVSLQPLVGGGGPTTSTGLSGNSILSVESGPSSSQVQMPTLVSPPLADGSVELSLSGFQQDAPVGSSLISGSAGTSVATPRQPISGHYVISRPQSQQQVVVAPVTASQQLQPPANHYSYYERHKWLQHQRQSQFGEPISDQSTLEASALEHNETPPPIDRQDEEQSEEQEIQVHNLSPMSQQQYQTLLRDMKLCNSSSAGYLSNQQKLGGLAAQQQKSSKHQLASINNSQQHQLKLASQHLSSLLHQSNRDDLVHLHKSPDYCEADSRNGFAGISSRVCSNDPDKPDNCDRLCCGRGHREIVYQHSYKCDCKFQYCCSIWCSVCEKEIKALVCN